jgi:serine/threonine-protein kinase
VPDELAVACEQAMARDARDRHATAEAFAEALQSWLDGSKRREQALAVVARAHAKAPEAAALRARAAALRARAAAALKDVAGWQPEEDKAGAWAQADEAAALEERAVLVELEEEALLRASLTHAPELPEAHAALAERARAAHAASEAMRASPARPEALLRQHLAALSEDHPVRRSGVAYLKGDGALTLVTDPPGAEVLLYRYEPRNRRLVEVQERVLGRTPLRSVSLRMGSYLCVLRHPERAPVRYPVFLARGEHWDGVPPEGGDPDPVRLPRREELGPDDCYVPAGWFWSGGDPRIANGLPRRRLWVEGQVFRRFPVTNQEYLSFLDALVATGREEEALRYAPREGSGKVTEPGPLLYGYDGRRFVLRPDLEGDVWDPRWPVMMVDWHGAAAYARWLAAESGRPWGLPGELAWEKAARGVDGRLFPWGDQVDPSWACTSQGHRGRPLPAPVDSHPVDQSVYGVRGLGGNISDWCADAYQLEGPPVVGGRPADGPEQPDPLANRVNRGGCWNSAPTWARTAFRIWNAPASRYANLGFRLARPYP